MDLDAVEETFDDNNRRSVGHRPVEIEEYKRLPESWREPVFRMRLVDRSAGVGDQESVFVVNRYNDATCH